MSVLAHPLELDDHVSTTTPNSVLGKAFSILSAFDGDNETLRLVDLCQRSGVPKPSVYRLARSSWHWGCSSASDRNTESVSVSSP